MSDTNTSAIPLQGWPVLRVWAGAVYVRLPAELQRPIEGGCSCEYCRQHPHQTPAWDVLGVPLIEQGRTRQTWTIHAPDWRVGDRFQADTVVRLLATSARPPAGGGQ